MTSPSDFVRKTNKTQITHDFFFVERKKTNEKDEIIDQNVLFG